jgi:SagB-type dehydrogenase family enzyme
MRQECWSRAWSGSTMTVEPWEVFHENSKTNRFDPGQPIEYVRVQMDRLLQALPYDQYPAYALPGELEPLPSDLASVIEHRVTARSMEPCPVTVRQLATLLHYAYGVTRTNDETVFPRPFRVVPSGGALYPLELYFHSTHIIGLPPGLYHYNPMRNEVCRLRPGDDSRRLSEALVQHNLAVDNALMIFISAIFERSTFKYGDRGYRFVLLETGHVAQNLNLVAGAMNLGSTNIGGFFDRAVDDLLGLDGVSHSTVYLTAIGRNAEAADASDVA